jgi:hypothetical protein
VTLVVHELGSDWYSEPFLNILAATAQGSLFPHCELSIGEECGQRGEMLNVLRIFNDSTGVVSLATPTVARSLSPHMCVRVYRS